MTCKNVAILALSFVAATRLVNASEASAQTALAGQDTIRLERFEKQVDDLRNRLKIPGLSAVIVKDLALLDVAALVGVGGIWAWWFLGQLKQRPLLPLHDPYLSEYLPEAIRHE